ncbi:MAG: hypothetical protein IKQ44_00770 [Lachnospiraceae bacterium]|nr:hypothetical protein [Lachnospiraceae bacterium]
MKEKINIQFIGVSGSGKTMLLSAVSHGLFEGSLRGTNGAVISATASSHDAKFGGAGYLNGLSLAQIFSGEYRANLLMAKQDKNGKIGPAAAGTVNTTNFHFDFDVHTPEGRTISEPMRLTDYRGGILSLRGTNLSEIDTAECSAFSASLEEADVVIILLDGIKLAQYRNNESKRREKTGADRINVLMNAYTRMPKKGITTMILVTKTDSDQIPQDLKANNFKGLCDLARQTLSSIDNISRSLTSAYGWNLSVIPVSAIGHGNSVTRYIPEIDEYMCALTDNADIRPENVDTAIIYGIKSAIIQRSKELDAEIKIYDSKITEELSHLSVFNARQHKANIEQYRIKKNKAQTLQNKYTKMLAYINEGFSGRFENIRRFGLK